MCYEVIKIKTNIIKIFILLIAIIFIALGIVNNEPKSVFRKATTICLECIGIG